MGEFTPALVKPVVGIEALDVLDMRVGTIERVEEIPGSEKLRARRCEYLEIQISVFDIKMK